MYKVVTLKDTARVPPSKFKDDKVKTITEILRETYEGTIEESEGVNLCVFNVRDIGTGKIVPGDGAAYYPVTFDMLTFNPKPHEILRGEVSEIAEFGAFVRIGPIDGLVHVSQITDDLISYDSKNTVLSGKQSGKVLKVGDRVRVKIATVSIKKTINESKIGLTMRSPELGKEDWIKAKKEKSPADKKKVKK